jgi:hypothetical protein
MALAYSARLKKAMTKRRSSTGWNIHQFGQANDYYTFNGATGCTHTILQWLIYLWKGKKVSQDTISKVAQYPLPGRNGAQRGLTPTEVTRVVKYYGLPYKIVFGLTAKEVRSYSKKGPVGFGHAYSWWPEWKGYIYAGVKADGRPNGYATPTGAAGKNQLKGFTGAHFGLLLGIATDPDAPDLVYAWEPNHGSPSRPQKPAYDRMRVSQFDAVYDSYRKVLGRTSYALVPTKDLPA